MKCLIGNSNLKTWGKAVHTLVSSGDDNVHFQFTNTSVTLTTFDSSLAVCCKCAFERHFFESYEISIENILACRVPSKCLLKAFRSMKFLTKSVNSCEINFEENGSVMGIVLTTKWGPKIDYSIQLSMEAEALELDCDTGRLANWIKVDPKLLLGSISNFGPTNKVSDLTIKTLDNKILLKNCTTDVVKREGKLYTELSVNSVDFTEYAIRENSEITVPLREFKTFASFAEGLKLELSLHFQSSNDPVIIKIQNEFYSSTLTLATKILAGGTSQQASSQAASGSISNASSNVEERVQLVQVEPIPAAANASAADQNEPQTDIEMQNQNQTRMPIENEPHTDMEMENGLQTDMEIENELQTDMEMDNEHSQSLLENFHDIPNSVDKSPEPCPVSEHPKSKKSSQPPKKKLRTASFIFPDLGKQIPYFPQGMDRLLQPESDDEDS